MIINAILRLYFFLLMSQIYYDICHKDILEWDYCQLLLAYYYVLN